MAILLTGGAGYIGSHCFYALQSIGEDIVVLDDLSEGKKELLPDDSIFYKGNVGDSQILNKIFQENTIDTVFHLAGSVDVFESVYNPKKYYDNNTNNSLNLLKSCLQHNVLNFIFSSTASVYGNNDKNMVSEEDTLSPENPYATSKMMTELMLKDFHKTYGLNYIIMRYFNVAGADSNLRTGQISKKATHLIKVACETAVGKREKISVFGTDYKTHDGTCIRDYIHVADLVDAHLCVLKYLRDSDSIGEIFNCGYGKGFSVKEVLKAFENITQKSMNIQYDERRRGDAEALIANSQLLQKKTGWKPKFDNLDKIVSSALEWEKFIIKKDF